MMPSGLMSKKTVVEAAKNGRKDEDRNQDDTMEAEDVLKILKIGHIFVRLIKSQRSVSCTGNLLSDPQIVDAILNQS